MGRAAAALLLALGACTPLPIPTPEAAAEAPPPPADIRVFGIQRPIDTTSPQPPPRLPLR